MTGASLLSSADLRGGGGEGGWDAGKDGDFLASKSGVDGLLGILKCLGDELLGRADVGLSVVRYVGVLESDKFNDFFGGD